MNLKNLCGLRGSGLQTSPAVLGFRMAVFSGEKVIEKRPT